jgi:hypothetical protein
MVPPFVAEAAALAKVLDWLRPEQFTVTSVKPRSRTYCLQEVGDLGADL